MGLRETIGHFFASEAKSGAGDLEAGLQKVQANAEPVTEKGKMEARLATLEQNLRSGIPPEQQLAHHQEIEALRNQIETLAEREKSEYNGKWRDKDK